MNLLIPPKTINSGNIWDYSDSEAAPTSLWYTLSNRPLSVDIGRCTCIIVKEKSVDRINGGNVYTLYTNEGQGRQNRKLSVALHRRHNGRSEFIIAQNTKGILCCVDDSYVGSLTANLMAVSKLQEYERMASETLVYVKNTTQAQRINGLPTGFEERLDRVHQMYSKVPCMVLKGVLMRRIEARIGRFVRAYKYTTEIGFSLVSCDRLLHHHQMVVTDLAWNYGKVVPAPDGKKKAYKYVQCNFCAKVCKGGIGSKWEKQLHRHLHAAAYYLNPRFRWSPDVSEHGEIKRGLFHVMDTLVKNNEEYMKIEDQLITYKDKKGLFSYRGSLASYKTRPPVKWWEQYGDDTPEFKAFAVKVLGLTCSASACERNWSTYNQVHTKRRNRLNTQRMNDLVYIMYNKKLKQKFNKKSNLKENEDPLDVEYVMSDDEWTVGGDAEVVVPNGSGGVPDGGVAEFDGAVEVLDGGDEDLVVVGTVREEAGTVREAGTAPAVVAVASSSSRKRKKHAHALNLLDEDDEEAQYDSDALFAELDSDSNEDDEEA
ncbi:hypothetical protein LXL04_039712 [Taraxacum kok-saghyz]